MQNLAGIEKGAYKDSRRRRFGLDQRRGGDNIFPSGYLRVLPNVYNFNPAKAVQIFSA